MTKVPTEKLSLPHLDEVLETIEPWTRAQQVRRAKALLRIVDIKKRYDFWQGRMNKNMDANINAKVKARFGNDVDSEQMVSMKIPVGLAEYLRKHILKDVHAPELDKMLASGGSDFFSPQDVRFLRDRLYEIVSQNGIQLKDGEVDRLLESCVLEAQQGQGFDQYGHDRNSRMQDKDSQNDCDVDELEGDGSFLYDYPSRHHQQHHFEVELEGSPPCSGVQDDEHNNSCEFTFEYDCDGKLIPTSSNIEEKLRLMKLQSHVSCDALPLAQALAQALALMSGGSKKKKKKKKSQKKKKKGKVDDDHGDTCTDSTSSLCLFCQYESFYGVKPVWLRKQEHMYKLRWMKIRQRLQPAKHDKRAWHQRKLKPRSDEGDAGDDGASDGTVEDE